RSAAMAETQSYDVGAETAGRGWLDYVQGVTRALGVSHGFDADIDGDVPLGAGLSSSASLTVAVARALRGALSLPATAVDLARAAHRGATEPAGAPVGIMDPLVVSLGEPGWALHLDTRTLAMAKVAIPEAIEVVVIDSGVSHVNAGGGYVARRAECDRAA